MVAIGSAALPLRRFESSMEDDGSYKRGRKKMGMSRKPEKQGQGQGQGRSFDAGVSKTASGRGSNRESYSAPQTVVRYCIMSFFCRDGFSEWWEVCELLAFFNGFEDLLQETG